jgi:hypothetical protein
MLPEPPEDNRLAELNTLIDEIDANRQVSLDRSLRIKAPRARTVQTRRRRATAIMRAWRGRWKWGRNTVNGRAKGAA